MRNAFQEELDSIHGTLVRMGQLVEESMSSATKALLEPNLELAQKIIKEDDTIDVIGLTSFAPNTPLTLVIHHADGTKDEIKANHTYNAQQIEWFKAGGALNIIRANVKA